MAIDRVEADVTDRPARQTTRLGRALALGKTVIVVVLVMLSILVLLPAAVAAQAATL